LARLRNLTRETHKQVQDMGLLYDITKDYFYKEGLEKGKHEVVVNMLKKGTVSPEQIAEFTGVSLEEVKKIAKDLKK
jgi:transcription initiation factor IIE alpha subunit